MPDGTVPPAGIQSKEVLVMMMMTMNNAFMNISTMLAEDAGAPELRNPLAGGMRAKGLLGRLFGRKNRAD
jgi:hypothetical protein